MANELPSLKLSQEVKTYSDIVTILQAVLKNEKYGINTFDEKKKRKVKSAISSLDDAISISIAQETINMVKAYQEEHPLKDLTAESKKSKKYAAKLNKYDEKRRAKLTNKAFKKLQDSNAKSSMIITDYSEKKLTTEQGANKAFPFPAEEEQRQALFDATGLMPQVATKVAELLQPEEFNALKNSREWLNKSADTLQKLHDYGEANNDYQKNVEEAEEDVRRIYPDVLNLISQYENISILEYCIRQISQALESPSLPKNAIGCKYLNEFKKTYEGKQTETRTNISGLHANLKNNPIYDAINKRKKDEDITKKIVNAKTIQIIDQMEIKYKLENLAPLPFDTFVTSQYGIPAGEPKAKLMSKKAEIEEELASRTTPTGPTR